MLSSFVCLLPDFNLSKILDTDTGSGRSTIANMNPRWLVSGAEGGQLGFAWLAGVCLPAGGLPGASSLTQLPAHSGPCIDGTGA